MRSGLRNVLIPLLALLGLPVLLVALLWLLLPVIALPLANLATGLGSAEREVVISRLELARPGAEGIRIAALELQLSAPKATLRAEGITVDWRLGRDEVDGPGLLDGALRALRVARLELEASLPGPAAAPDTVEQAGFDWAAMLPSALRARLPIGILQLDAVQMLLRIGSETLEGRGRLRLEQRRMELEATVESARLALPVQLTANIGTDDSFELQLLDARDDAMLSAQGAVEIDGPRLTLTGSARFDTMALGPALGLEMPPVVGDLNGMLQRNGEIITLRLDPRTQLGAHLALGGGAGAGADAGGMRGVGFALRTKTPFSLTLDGDHLSSEGTLPVSFAVTGSFHGTSIGAATGTTAATGQLEGRLDEQLDGSLELAELSGTLSAPSARVRASGTAGRAPLRGSWRLDAHIGSTETGVLQLRKGALFMLPELEYELDAAAAEDEALDIAGRGREAGPAAVKLTGLRVALTSDLAFDPVGPVLESSAMTVTLEALDVAQQRLDLGKQRLELQLAIREEVVDVGFDVAGADLSARGSARHGLAEASTAMRLEAASFALGPTALPALLAGIWLETPWPLRRGTATLSGNLRWPPAGKSVGASGTASREPPGRSPADAPATPGDSPARDAVADLHIAGEGLDLALAGVDLGGARLSATLRADDSGRVSLGDILGSAATLEYRSAPDGEALRAAGVSLGGALTITGAGLPSALPDPADLRLDAEAITVSVDRTVAFGYGLDGLRLQASADGALLDPTAILNIEADALQMGVDLSDLRCGLDMESGLLSIRRCRAGLLGGEVLAPTGRWSLATGDGYVPIALLGLDLGAALALMQDAALAGTGLLDGAVPLELVGGKPIIVDGYVGARPPGGTLRYAADAALRERLSQPGLSLVLTAMQDFRFAELGADIDYDADGELTLGVRLVGASPEVEQGRRINFNLNVTQNLPVLLESLRLSQEIGEDLERRLQERFAL